MHELGNVEFERDRSGDPPCTGVGLFEVAQVLEANHLVADCGRRDAKVEFFVEGVGTNGLTSGGIFLDNGFDNTDLTRT